MKAYVSSLTRVIVLAGAVATLAGGIPSPAQEPDPAASAALSRFLRLDCGVDTGRSPLDAILLYRDAVEPELEHLLREGPDDASLEMIRTIAEERWSRLESFLQTDPQLGLDPQSRLDVVTLTRDEFVAREVHRFTRGHLERAVIGLAAIGSPGALDTLREVRESADDELRDFIDATLRRQRPTIREATPSRRERSAGAAGKGSRRPVRN